MKLYLITYRLYIAKYMGKTIKGDKDYHIVWAETMEEANAKLERELAPPASPGDDINWLHIIETKEAIT